MTPPPVQHSIINLKPRVLVIDDDEHLLKLLASTLRRSGLDVTTAATGTEALRSLEKNQFDLVLSDVDLPDVTGLEICKQLKKDPKRQHTAVIIMSGRLAEDMESLALGSGAIDFISKPFEAKIVLAKIFAQISKGETVH